MRIWNFEPLSALGLIVSLCATHQLLGAVNVTIAPRDQVLVAGQSKMFHAMVATDQKVGKVFWNIIPETGSIKTWPDKDRQVLYFSPRDLEETETIKLEAVLMDPSGRHVLADDSTTITIVPRAHSDHEQK